MRNAHMSMLVCGVPTHQHMKFSQSVPTCCLPVYAVFKRLTMTMTIRL